MRALVICLFLVGCATDATDLVGKPIEDAISEYGNPVSAVDYEGARAFYFETGKEQEIKENKVLMDPNMPIPSTSYRSSQCIYTMNALWTSTREEWVIHSVHESPNCKGKK